MMILVSQSEICSRLVLVEYCVFDQISSRHPCFEEVGPDWSGDAE